MGVRLGEGKETDMVAKGCEGDWEFKTPKAPVPVKLTVKKMNASDWMVACMVPRGNMMHCMLKEEEGTLKQTKFNITGKEPPLEIMRWSVRWRTSSRQGSMTWSGKGRHSRWSLGLRTWCSRWTNSELRNWGRDGAVIVLTSQYTLM